MAKKWNRNPFKRKGINPNKRILLIREKKAKEPKNNCVDTITRLKSSKPEPNLRKISKRNAIKIYLEGGSFGKRKFK